MNPTARSKQLLQKQGYLVTSVEKDVRFPNPENPQVPITIKKDAFGFGDLLYCGNGEIGLCQSTTRANSASRIAKIYALTNARIWLKAGGKILIHGWAKQGPRGGRKLWQPNEKLISLQGETSPEPAELPQAIPEPAKRQRRAGGHPVKQAGLFSALRDDGEIPQ